MEKEKKRLAWAQHRYGGYIEDYQIIKVDYMCGQATPIAFFIKSQNI